MLIYRVALGDMFTTTMKTWPDPTSSQCISIGSMTLVHQATTITNSAAIIMWVVARASLLATGSSMQRPMKVALIIILMAMHSMTGIRISVWNDTIYIAQKLMLHRFHPDPDK